MRTDKKDHHSDNKDFLTPDDRRASDDKDRSVPTAIPVSGLRLAGLIGGPIAAIIILLLPAPAGMPFEAWRLVAMAVWMVTWWLTEAVPIPATALLPIILMPLLSIDKIKPVAANYADPLIYLFLGGFLLAAAMQHVGLHRRIALKIVSRIGSSPSRIILGFMLATAFLSMWISNTATTIMMFAVGLSVIDFISKQTEDKKAVRNFGVALMLSIAYSASIGGVGTLIGTPSNALLASFLQSTYNIQITFFNWMLLGVPVVVLMLPTTWLILTKLLFPSHQIAIEDPGSVVDRELTSLGIMSRGEKLVGIVFLCAALGWIFRGVLVDLTGLPLDDTMIAILAAMVLFAVPISRTKGEFALDWEAARNVPWGVLLLFGGGLALASGFKSTGLAEWIGNSVAGVDISTVLLVLLVTVVIVYLTEITSNTASTATFLPILAAVAVGFGLDPRILTIPVALAASMAFMMPVATPPNAIVFSYEQMELRDMVRAGFLLNILAIIVSFGLFMLLGNIVFGLVF
ncbi:SLC13 family permease [Neptunomonas qingdaonensis]|uniref:Solute carrier family 13 (Sodium-dependent dicarboxylate transporter), member 2/3/5 n=1 Tax=Neptunomonas qingdaonensis TaxID=1045558 RepID=A0A1I2UWX8_9GAMM|nr:DASS family sodium-coupled anion symporter [Neptunomonas qingdaonensis]SFG80357.1 solute carrier family 13 (sodium-dependent dicarboxylate transporter), member 2/3/5 [Neptunomonas qingdaonensis]